MDVRADDDVPAWAVQIMREQAHQRDGMTDVRSRLSRIEGIGAAIVVLLTLYVGMVAAHIIVLAPPGG